MRRSFLFLVNFSPLFMPALSPSMETGTIVEWKKKVGDLVNENEVFCTVQTDKAVVDYTNTFDAGYLAKILCHSGETVPVAKTIAVMVEDEADIPKIADYRPRAKHRARRSSPTHPPCHLLPPPHPPRRLRGANDTGSRWRTQLQRVGLPSYVSPRGWTARRWSRSHSPAKAGDLQSATSWGNRGSTTTMCHRPQHLHHRRLPLLLPSPRRIAAPLE
ncbi:putative dihydrolipoamide acetyltransferase precursor [Trypanosoma cruzi]|uniref:Putative dihydrolipoamide acetyltransferase n=1 Tax=Trypanosoma cruzi TaxID=5693 RepID=A0A2V2VHV6_TRYCR|nr:putative dihydrolipoamide acetyltransferase precursor [Trypanosoma cruzi]